MQEQFTGRPTSQVQDERVTGGLARIEELKEALKHVRNMADEMALLRKLTQEITDLRHLRESTY